MSLNHIVSQNTSDKLDCSFRDVICRNLTCDSLTAPAQEAGLPLVVNSIGSATAYYLSLADFKNTSSVYFGFTRYNNLALPTATDIKTFLSAGQSKTYTLYINTACPDGERGVLSSSGTYTNIRTGNALTPLVNVYGAGVVKVDIVVYNNAGTIYYLV